MWIDCHFLVYLLLFNLNTGLSQVNNRLKRYLIFTSGTQFGVFATVSVPLHPESTTSVAWFYEANYYTVDNSTYYWPLLGDIPWSRSHEKRSIGDGSENLVVTNDPLTRRLLYASIEALLVKYKLPGRPCLLRAICEAATSSLMHNGVLGDLLHLALTPSTSSEETEVEDCFYEAEYRGILHDCVKYQRRCSMSPLDYISIHTELL